MYGLCGHLRFSLWLLNAFFGIVWNGGLNCGMRANWAMEVNCGMGVGLTVGLTHNIYIPNSCIIVSYQHFKLTRRMTPVALFVARR